MLRKIRLVHRYLGLFFSPAILLFSLSGALQTFNLHQANTRTGYVPPAWLVELAQIHKKQTTDLPKEKTKPATSVPEPHDPAPARKASSPGKSTLPLKCFVVMMSAGLMATTLLGIYMSFSYGGNRVLVCATLAGGVLLPVAMMFFA